MIAPRNIEETAEDGNGNGDGGDEGDGDVDDTTSGGGIHLMRVKTVLLAIESQYMRQSRRTRNGHLPVLPGSPIQHANRPYRDARRQR